ncbi:HesA/MoeB/ThiF family protein [Paraburkholderia aspalathi]|uniref:HesA/MoeB/ThiF family protein n=1 Tax=Paraburkholderia aspalathi TaxID=1324617 RepID=UPI003C9EEC23
MTIQSLVPIPYDECKVRERDRVTWSSQRLVPLLEKAARRDLGILKIHSHPGGFRDFSSIDDEADKDLFNSVFGWTDSAFPHASAVMLPDGSMFGRAIQPDGSFQRIDSILVPGDNLHFWTAEQGSAVPSFAKRHAQLFGSGTTQRLREMSVAVVGCSGTGSPVIEQLARLGVGRLVIVDPDHIEDKNLNRILNATREDAYLRRPKVEVMARAIAAMGFGTELEIIADDLATPRAVRAVAACDVVFGCMDGVEGRHLLNRLAALYVLPYFDLGVKLEADGQGSVNEACGAVHYIRPDGSTLLDRKVYTVAQLKSAGLKRTDPKAYREQVKAGYIKGVAEDRPAVISINMQIASTAVNEFLARLHPYRYDDNAEFAVVRKSFIQGAEYRETEGPSSGTFTAHVGKGDVRPLLSMPELSEAEDVS